MLIESLLFSGSITASSYLPVAIILIMVEMETNRARAAKSSGEYIRLITGEINIGMAWAIAVPLINVETFLKNSDRNKRFITDGSIILIPKVKSFHEKG
jgi:hypothetical protein